MKIGYLHRVEDENGISGTGRVAEVIVSDTGKVVVFWLSETPSVNFYDSIGDVRSVHGHAGKTEIRWEPDWKRAYNEVSSAIGSVSLLDLIRERLPEESNAKALLERDREKE